LLHGAACNMGRQITRSFPIPSLAHPSPREQRRLAYGLAGSSRPSGVGTAPDQPPVALTNQRVRGCYECILAPPLAVQTRDSLSQGLPHVANIGSLATKFTNLSQPLSWVPYRRQEWSLLTESSGCSLEALQAGGQSI